MPVGGYVPKLTIEMSEEQALRLQGIFNHGEKRQFFSAVIDAAIVLHDSVGKQALYAIISRDLQLLDAVRAGVKAKEA
jgi:hypothetical protein